LEERNISLILKKVAAHSDDPFNNKVDQLAKSSLFHSPLPIQFKHTPYISYLPTFNNMPILTTLRPFLKDFTNTKHFIDFYSLKRNLKYNLLHINWSLTFEYIKLGTPTETSFKESRAHCRRLKFLFEQIPTIEFLKATQSKLYNSSWKCCRCLVEEENFNHIWTCVKIKKEMKDIINESLQILKQQLFIHTSKSCYPQDISSLLLSSHSYWSLRADPHNFTFIDFIKGIVLTSLPKLLDSFTKSPSLTSKILSTFYDYIFDQTYEIIWKSRCKSTIEKERTLNISSYSKKHNYSSSHYYAINSFSNSLPSNHILKYDHISLMTKSYVYE